MSSKVTGDAQPNADTPAETDQTLPTEIVENLSGAGAVTVAENTENTDRPRNRNRRRKRRRRPRRMSEPRWRKAPDRRMPPSRLNLTAAGAGG